MINVLQINIVKRNKFATFVANTLLLFYSTRAYLFSPGEGLCCMFSAQNNCYKFLALKGVYLHRVHYSFMKVRIFGASCSQYIHSIIMYEVFL